MTRTTLSAAALSALLACQSAGFESLGSLQPSSSERPTASQDAGARDAGARPEQLDAGAPVTVDASAPAIAGSQAPAAVSGSGGMAATSGSGGTAGAPAMLTGAIGGMPFNAQVGYVSGYSDELATTTIYLFDAAVSCSQLSTFAWLSQLSPSIHVLEVMFPESATPGTQITSASASYMKGGMYSFSKTRASMVDLTLSHVAKASDIEGTLSATFSSGSVDGAFHAEFCTTGIVL